MDKRWHFRLQVGPHTILLYDIQDEKAKKLQNQLLLPSHPQVPSLLRALVNFSCQFQPT
jgi:hypothetical protein